MFRGIYSKINNLLRETNNNIERDCINCGKCLNVCPKHLTPSLLAKFSRAGRYEDCKEAYIDVCIECGICTFVCPANIPVTRYIKIAKQKLAVEV
jgi:electron transport complex protein RnfC